MANISNLPIRPKGFRCCLRSPCVTVSSTHTVLADCKPALRKALQRCAPKEGDILVVSVGNNGSKCHRRGQRPFAIVRSVLLLRPLNSRGICCDGSKALGRPMDGSRVGASASRTCISGTSRGCQYRFLPLTNKTRWSAGWINCCRFPTRYRSESREPSETRTALPELS